MKKKIISIGIFLLIILAISVYAARLPTVNSDNNAWGDVLNDFLGVAHDSAGNIKGDHITSTMILNGTVGNGDIARNTINTSHVIDATIGAIDIASAVINTTHIVDATINNSDLANDSVNTTNILDATIGAIDIAMDTLNSTHIVNNTILGNDISATAALNVTALAVSGVGVLNGSSNGTNMNSNVTGIYFGYTAELDIGSVGPGRCLTLNVTMSGLPAGAYCIPISSADFGVGSTLNLTLMPARSMVAGTCALRICNGGDLVPTDPPATTYSYIAFTFADAQILAD